MRWILVWDEMADAIRVVHHGWCNHSALYKRPISWGILDKHDLHHNITQWCKSVDLRRPAQDKTKFFQLVMCG